MQRPEGDRYLMTQSELESRIQVLLAGTIAEEMIFDDISTGAQNDLERATEIARSMVMDYGMSELGRVNYRESNRSAFLTGIGEERMHSHSERTAQEIDTAVRRIVDDSLEKVREILTHRRAALVALAEELMVIESVDAQQLQRILDEHSASPRVVPGTADALKRPAAGPVSSDASEDVRGSATPLVPLVPRAGGQS